MRPKALLTIILLLIILLIGCEKNVEKPKTNLIESRDSILGLEEYTPASALSTSFCERIFYEVSDIQWEDTTGRATVIVTTPDLESIIYDSIETAIESNGTEDYTTLLAQVKSDIQSVLESDNCPMVDREVEMEAVGQNDDYSLVSNESFERIIQGNIAEIFLNTLIEGE